MATILDLTEPEIHVAPFNLPTPKTLYHRTKHEVDRMTHCGYIVILNFPNERSVVGRRSVVNIYLLTLISYTPLRNVSNV